MTLKDKVFHQIVAVYFQTVNFVHKTRSSWLVWKILSGAFSWKYYFL